MDVLLNTIHLETAIKFKFKMTGFSLSILRNSIPFYITSKKDKSIAMYYYNIRRVTHWKSHAFFGVCVSGTEQYSSPSQ